MIKWLLAALVLVINVSSKHAVSIPATIASKDRKVSEYEFWKRYRRK
jgi:hypothetical protein